jgi:predicted HTH domain antitoxin
MTEYLTDEGLKFLIPRYFKNKSELLDEAVKLILRSNLAIRVELAVNLYVQEKVSLAKAAEISGVTTPEFKEILAEKGYKRVMEGDSIENIDQKIKEVFG